MSILPVSHFEWQVLRTVKRNKKPSVGRTLRLIPTRRTKDGSFLTEMVERGLLERVTGAADSPFDATYSLTERGEYAAEYGECEFSPAPKAAAPATERKPTAKAKPKAGRKTG